MTCDYCGDTIHVGDEYYHFPNLDLNYHLDCRLSDELMLKNEKRYREE